MVKVRSMNTIKTIRIIRTMRTLSSIGMLMLLILLVLMNMQQHNVKEHPRPWDFNKERHWAKTKSAVSVLAQFADLGRLVMRNWIKTFEKKEPAREWECIFWCTLPSCLQTCPIGSRALWPVKISVQGMNYKGQVGQIKMSTICELLKYDVLRWVQVIRALFNN